MPVEDSSDVTLAVAVRDIEWIKESQRSTNRGIEQLQNTISQYMKDQTDRSEKYATKQELDTVKREVESLKLWRKGLTTAISLVVGAAIVGFEYLKQWIGGTGH